MSRGEESLAGESNRKESAPWAPCAMLLQTLFPGTGATSWIAARTHPVWGSREDVFPEQFRHSCGADVEDGRERAPLEQELLARRDCCM